MGELPNTDSSESEAPLKLIENPPNGFFAAFAICQPPPRCVVVPPRTLPLWYYYHIYEGP